MKTLRRLAILLLLLSAGVFAAYYYGLRPDNYQIFFSELLTELTGNKKDIDPAPDTLTAVVKKTNTPKKARTHPVKKEEKIVFQPLPPNPYAAIDKHARACPKSEERSIESLAAYLKQPAANDLEKARAIYVWLTQNIRYDDAGFNSDLDGDYSAEGVLKSRKAVCEGFSNLFLALGRQMDLQIEKVSGYSKGYGYKAGDKFKDSDHAWNIIKINNQWRVFDATWGEGNGKNVNGKLVSKKAFNNYWFNVSPYEAVFTHMPENKAFLNVEPKIDLKTFENFPNIEKGYFEMGFNGTETYRAVCNNRSLAFPETYAVETFVKVAAAPKYAGLETGRSYVFELYVPRGVSLAMVDAKNNWSYFEMDKGKFTLTYTPSISGELSLVIRHEKGGKSFHTLLTYTVKEPRINV